MQHKRYGLLNSLYPTSGFLKKLFKANIKTLQTYPKSIWYSLRYNNGERFLLHDQSIYPFNYDTKITQEQESEPVRLSTKLLANINELWNLNYINSYGEKEKTSFGKNYKNQLCDSLKETYLHLYKIIEYNRKDESLDLPAAVYARILYASSIISTLKNSKDGDLFFSQNENNIFDKNVLNIVLQKFLQKVEYADADSLASVMYALTKFKHFQNEVWTKLIHNLQGKKFTPEFTLVQPKLPFVFRYSEVTPKNLNIYYYSKGVFQADWALRESSRNGVDSAEGIKTFEQRFNLKNDEGYEKFKNLL
jgi:hypothetical protein